MTLLKRQMLRLVTPGLCGLEALIIAFTSFSPRRVIAVGIVSSLPSKHGLADVDAGLFAREQVAIHKSPRQFIEYLDVETTLEMVIVPGGTFEMGSSDTELAQPDNSHEGPKQTVAVDAFSIGKYPVTQSQWRAVASLPKERIWLDPTPSSFTGDRHPVERVSWHEAIEFCQRLSRHTGLSYRLPTEAEWEYACRANTTTPFHTGDSLSPTQANYNSHSTPLFKRSHEHEIDEMLRQSEISSSPVSGTPGSGSGQSNSTPREDSPSPIPSQPNLPEDPPPNSSPSDQQDRPSDTQTEPYNPTKNRRYWKQDAKSELDPFVTWKDSASHLSAQNATQPLPGFSLLQEINPIRYRQQTTPAGSFNAANDFGLFDMHGNVWEWCASPWHESLDRQLANEPVAVDSKSTSPSTDSSMMPLRGGAWYTTQSRCRSASRQSASVYDQSYFVGFRVVCDSVSKHAIA